MALDLAALLKGVTAPKAVAPLSTPQSPMSQALANILKMSGTQQAVPNFQAQGPVGQSPVFDFSLGANNSNLGPSGGNNGPVLDPKVAKLVALNAKDSAIATSLGAPPTGKRPSIIHRVFDILSRPEYALSNAALQGDIGVSHGDSILKQFGEMGSGALQGIEGKAKTMPTDVIQQLRDAANARGQSGFLNTAFQHGPVDYTPGQAGPVQSILGKGLGIGANIVSDPLNLVGGVGIPEKLTNVAKGLGKAGEVSDATRTASRVAEAAGISKPGELESLVKPATSIPTITQGSETENRVQQILNQLQPALKDQHLGQITAAKEAEGLGGATLRTGQTVTSRLAHTVKNVDKISPADLVGDSKKATTNRLAMEIHGQADAQSLKAYKDIQSGVLEDMSRATKPETIRRAAIKIAGKQITLTPERISRSLRNLGDETGISSANRAFEHAFVSTGKMSPELQALSGVSRGIQHGPYQKMIIGMGQRFHGMKDTAIGNSLRHIVNNTPELGSSPEIESAIHSHVGDIVDQIRGTEAKPGLPIEDFNHHLSSKDKLNINPESSAIINGPNRDHAIAEFESLMSKGVEKNTDHPLDYLARLGNGGIKAQAQRAIRGQLTKFGVKDEGPVADALKSQHGYKELKQTPGYIYHPDIHNDASRMFELLNNYGSSEEFTKGLGKIVNVWKKLATVYNLPSYPTRNFIANSYMAWLAGGQHGLEGVKSSFIAAKQLRHRLDKTTRGSIDPIHDVMSRELDKEIGKNGSVLYRTKGGFPVSPDLNDAAYRGNGLESTFTGTSYTAHPSTATGVRAAAHKVNSGVLAANKAVEDFGRHGVFIHHMRLSNVKNQAEFEKEAANAANKVRKALFDYSDSTAFEKKTMVKLFPFYKWNRKAIPALFHGLLDHPGKVLNFQMALEQGLQAAGGAGATPNDPWGLTQDEPLSRIPSYILDRMGSPFGKEGKTGAQQYLDPAVPFNDELRLLGDPSSIISQINPALRVPIEDTMGKQFYHDLPIKNRAEYSTVGQVNILRSLLKASGNNAAPVGASGIGGGSVATSKSPLDALLQTFNPLNGVIGAQQNTPKSQAATLLGHNTVLSKKIKALKLKAEKNATG